MSDIFESVAKILLLVAVSFAVGFGMGVAASFNYTAGHCDDLGAFTSHGKVYACHERASQNKGVGHE